jgi:hypothetical protein
MQGSSGGASSLLYSAAVMVRFFDAVALALFAPDLRLVLLGDEHRSKDLCGAQAWKPVFLSRFQNLFSAQGQRRDALRHVRDVQNHEIGAFQVADPKRRGLGSITPTSGSDFRLANKTAVQFFVALRGS